MVELLGGSEVRALAEELGVAPTKKLGQNFVTDPIPLEELLLPQNSKVQRLSLRSVLVLVLLPLVY